MTTKASRSRRATRSNPGRRARTQPVATPGPLPPREQFIAHLRDVVLPEFREMRAHMTVEDFETALRFIEDEDRRDGDLLELGQPPRVLN